MARNLADGTPGRRSRRDIDSDSASTSGRTRRRRTSGRRMTMSARSTLLHPFADYFAINVSSPNTAGLRDLQESRTLRALVEQVVARVGEKSAGRAIPVLVKMSPDAPDNDLLRSVEAAVEGGAAGVIATNTTVARPALEHRADRTAGGRPERRAAEVNGKRRVQAALPPSGTTNPDRRCRRHLHGRRCLRAHSVRGGARPDLHGVGVRRTRDGSRMLTGLAARLSGDGFSRIEEAIGIDVH